MIEFAIPEAKRIEKKLAYHQFCIEDIELITQLGKGKFSRGLQGIIDTVREDIKVYLKKVAEMEEKYEVEKEEKEERIKKNRKHLKKGRE